MTLFSSDTTIADGSFPSAALSKRPLQPQTPWNGDLRMHLDRVIVGTTDAASELNTVFGAGGRTWFYGAHIGSARSSLFLASTINIVDVSLGYLSNGE